MEVEREGGNEKAGASFFFFSKYHRRFEPLLLKCAG